MTWRWPLGALLAAVVAAGGYRRRALSGRGALAALAVGAAVFGGAGLPGAAGLLWFFLSSSFLTRLAERRNALEAGKGSRRDAAQVLANGGVAAALALAHAAGGRRAFAGVAGALAAANADTWATEVGLLAGGIPRRITDLRPMAPGSSGGMTPAGTLASLAGAASLAAVTRLAQRAAPGPAGARFVAAVTVAGVAGSLLDSLLGATLQEQRWCPACARPTETRRHRCGTPTRYYAGLRGFDNDMVNLAATTAGAAAAAALTRSA